MLGGAHNGMGEEKQKKVQRLSARILAEISEKMKLRKIVVEREHFKTVCEKFQAFRTLVDDQGTIGFVSIVKGVEIFYHVKHMPKEPVPSVTTDPVNYFL